jgi:hypothetical protein
MAVFDEPQLEESLAMLSWKHLRISEDNSSDNDDNYDNALEVDPEIAREKFEEPKSRGTFYLLILSMSFGA